MLTGWDQGKQLYLENDTMTLYMHCCAAEDLHSPAS